MLTRSTVKGHETKHGNLNIGQGFLSHEWRITWAMTLKEHDLENGPMHGDCNVGAETISTTRL